MFSIPSLYLESLNSNQFVLIIGGLTNNDGLKVSAIECLNSTAGSGVCSAIITTKINMNRSVTAAV